MADNVAITAGAGTSVATDDIGTVQFQRIKLIHGADGVNDGDVSSVNGLPTKVVDAGNVISTANSSTAVLAGAAVFTGTSEDVSGYASIKVAVIASHASATDGLSVQQSTDGTNWDFIDTYTIPAASGRTLGFQPSARYFRIVYTNGGTLQTYFRLQTVYHRTLAKSSSQRPQDATSNETDLEQMQAFGMVWNGATWDRVTQPKQFWYEADVPGVAAAVYAAGDQFGTLITITNAARVTGGGGMITGVTLFDNDDLQVGADVFFFNDTLTLAIDNAVYAISDADARKHLWACQFPYFMDTGAQRVASNVGVSVPYFCTGTSLFAAVRTQSAITPSATGVRIRVSMIRD